MHPHLETVRAFIDEKGLIDAGTAVLVGLSGGVDSVVLTEMLHRLGFKVSALHVNYRLRGDASDEDERFVRSLGAELGVHIHAEAFDTHSIAKEQGRSVQETARELRYGAFERVADVEFISRVAVGHHRDDQAETVLLNLFRGTGPEGLAGMPIRRPLREGSAVDLVRPLLCLHRREIEAYASERGIKWREDATNEHSAYRRSAIRGRIIPLIEEHFGAAATENVARSADLMRAYVDRVLADDVREAFAAAAEAPVSAVLPDAPALPESPESPALPESPESPELPRRDHRLLGQLDLTVLRQLEPVLRGRVVLEAVRRWLPDLGAARRTVDEIVSLMEAQPGRRLVHPTGTIWRERERLLFVRTEENTDAGAGPEIAGVEGSGRSDDSVAVLESERPAAMPGGVVDLSVGVKPPPNVTHDARLEEYVDADRLARPIVVRRWLPGDRFIPLGMKQSKKISDFLTDEKVPPHRRASVLVVQAGDEIAWVVGHRIAETVRIRAETRTVARLRFHPAENT